MTQIRYANCWEDAEIILKAINVKSGGTYLSIASAGDNTLSILSKYPSLVLAVDINPAQIACLELRKAVFTHLSYENALKFLGINNSLDRIKMYGKLQELLSKESRGFWNKNPDLIRKGIIHAGKTEYNFRLFRKWILPFMLSGKQREELLKQRNRSERYGFYNKNFNSWRWKFFLKTVFGRVNIRYLDIGRDSKFYRLTDRDIAGHIKRRIEYALTTLSTHDNPYLEYIITGNFKNNLPFYLNRNNFAEIRKNIKNLVIFKGSIEKALQFYKEIKFDGFNLSDIFEYMSEDQYKNLLELIIQHSKEKTRLVYWNNLVKRCTRPSLKKQLKSLNNLADNLFLQNKAFFYKSLIIEEVQ